MHDYSDALANAVRNARQRLGKTQAEVSELIEASPRTILNIENRRANPKLHILFPLVQRLNIDPMELFFPDRKEETPAKNGLHIEIDRLSEEEADQITPVIKDLIALVRRKSYYFGPKNADNS